VSDTIQGADESLAASSRAGACTLSVVHSPDSAAVGRRLELSRKQNLFVGRDVPGGLSIKDERMSKSHFLVVSPKADFECADVGSTNGTFVDGLGGHSARLVHGTVIRAGNTLFVVSFTDPVRAVSDAASRLAPTDFPILLQGETGTGKELLARAIHAKSGRSGPLVPLNCAALSRELLPAELFGHARGAFSGAATSRPGLFRSAEGGTLFLDEIGDLPLELQPAFLRVLEERKVRPVGADHEIAVDARVLAATHVDLGQAVVEGAFRSDLYARLAHVVLRLPPLRERRAELLSLAAELAPGIAFSTNAAEALLLWHWPRNIRELGAVLEVVQLLGQKQGIVRLSDLRDQLPHAVNRVRNRQAPGALTAAGRPEPHPSLERRQKLLDLFEAHQGNVSKIAAELGKPRAQVYRWLKAAGLDVSELRKP
jgi:transcriptional regulator with GAF, ATPase, and Fis domain